MLCHSEDILPYIWYCILGPPQSPCIFVMQLLSTFFDDYSVLVIVDTSKPPQTSCLASCFFFVYNS